MPGNDLAPVEQKIDVIIDGLTKWAPSVKKKGTVTPSNIIIEGNDYEEALANMNNLFLKNLWSDGLPILPPTKERVSRLLTGTDLPPNTLVGGGCFLPRGGIATVEMLAVCLAMAGGRPEYMPVLIAAAEAVTNPVMTHHLWNPTTCNATPMVLVNGQVAKQIRLNSGYGCLGPSSEFPAGASIGRAIRFALMNMGGAIPGKGTMSLYGAGRYTNLVFAEDEAELPADWLPFNAEQGFSSGSNTLTVDVVCLFSEIFEGAAETEEETVDNLKSIARFIGSTFNVPPIGIPGYLLIGRTAAKQFSKLGWSKEKVKTFLWKHTKTRKPISQKVKKIVASPQYDKEIRWPRPVVKSPEDIKIVVCGGVSSGHGFWLQSLFGFRKEPAVAEIKLPANWERLLMNAEKDLGSIPTF